MPHRNQELVELCQMCRTPTTSHCKHCGSPLCEEHGPQSDDERCRRCEEEYAADTEFLRKAAGGHIHASMGRPTVAFSSVMILPLVTTFASLLSAAIGSAVFGLGAGAGLLVGGVAGGLGWTWFAQRWYRRTPPRWLAARRALRKKRKKFLKKRAKRLPELSAPALAEMPADEDG